MATVPSEWIFDWNCVEPAPDPGRPVMVVDETLRDGLQSPSVRHPDIQDKVYLLYLMRDLGIDAADLGLCGAGEKFKYHVTVLAREIVSQAMPIQPQSAARTLIADIAPIVEASEDAGIPIEACIFLGSSPIRQYAEGWDLDQLLRLTDTAVRFAVEHGLPVMFVTEDTTRARPETLRQVYTTAMRAGAQRLCAADTVGHATPEGVRALMAFLRNLIQEVNPAVEIDWHGHRDRGLDLINTLAAIRAGATRVHACALGIGERSGNTPLELLLVNLNLLAWANRDLTRLPEYCQVVADQCRAPIPFNYPVVGADSFRTATGVHAAALVKALAKGDEWLADRVYCGVPAAMVGRDQGIEVGPLSGEANVRFYLDQLGIEALPAYVEKILAAAKRANQILTEREVLRMVRVLRERQGQEILDADLARVVGVRIR